MVSKRERAKQRKAAAAKNPTSNNAEVGSGIRSTSRQFIKALNRMPTTKIVQLVKEGDSVTTAMLSDNLIKGISYQKSGVLSAVLGFLQRCEDETLDEVIDDSLGVQEGELAQTQIETPVYWIAILDRAADLEEPSCSLKIVESIGPLVEFMCDDVSRLFFKSNKHWNESIYPFARLINNLFGTSISQYSHGSETEDNMKVIDTLLKHDCLVRCFIQWGFWDRSRPDIANELHAKVCESIVEIGIMSARLLIAITAKSRGKKQVKSIGSMSIINKNYDSNCMVSYVEGLISIQMNRQGKSLGEQEAGFANLQYLIAETDCVDKGVINEMIRYGTNIVSDLVSAVRLTSLLFLMILHKTDTENLPCDTRTAAAIRAGLVEMCLNFVGRFEDHESSPSSKSLFDNVKNAFKMIYYISLHQKTAKAIRSKKKDIEEKLVSLEEDERISSNPTCQELLDMVRSLLNLSGSFCCRCNKQLSRKEVMECNGCGCMVYCSRACQKEDWLNGHSLTCCKPYADATSGQFQGRYMLEEVPEDERAARKQEDIEKNMNMIQLKQFLDNSEDILRQAEALKVPLYDCVILFDLRCCHCMIVS